MWLQGQRCTCEITFHKSAYRIVGCTPHWSVLQTGSAACEGMTTLDMIGILLQKIFLLLVSQRAPAQEGSSAKES